MQQVFIFRNQAPTMNSKRDGAPGNGVDLTPSKRFNRATNLNRAANIAAVHISNRRQSVCSSSAFRPDG